MSEDKYLIWSIREKKNMKAKTDMKDIRTGWRGIVSGAATPQLSRSS